MSLSSVSKLRNLALWIVFEQSPASEKLFCHLFMLWLFGLLVIMMYSVLFCSNLFVLAHPIKNFQEDVLSLMRSGDRLSLMCMYI